MAVDYLTASLDLLKALVALALFSYGVILYGTFSGGRIQAAFRYLMVAPLLFAVTEILNMLRNLGVVIYNERLIADSFELLFILTMFIGFYLFARVMKPRVGPATQKTEAKLEPPQRRG